MTAFGIVSRALTWWPHNLDVVHLRKLVTQAHRLLGHITDAPQALRERLEIAREVFGRNDEKHASGSQPLVPERMWEPLRT